MIQIFNYNKISKFNLFNILLVPLLFALIFSLINTINLHGDNQYFIQVYKEMNNFQFIYLYPTIFNVETVHPFAQSEFFLKFIFWLFSNLYIPKVFFDFVFIYIFCFCFFYISYFFDVKFIFTLIFFFCSFYIWNIIFSSIKNVIALDFFLISVIFYLKDKKGFFFLFYSLSILSAVGYLVLYFLFLISNLNKLNSFLKHNKFIKIVLFLIPLIVSFELVTARLTGYNIAPSEFNIKNLNTSNKNVLNKNFSNKNDLNVKTENYLSEIKNKQFVITLFTVKYKSKKYNTEFLDKKIILTYTIPKLAKLLFYLFLISLFCTNYKYLIFLCFFSVLIGGLIFFEKFNLFFYFTYLMSVLNYYQIYKKFNLLQKFFLFVFNIYLLGKQFSLINNLYYFNIPYVY